MRLIRHFLFLAVSWASLAVLGQTPLQVFDVNGNPSTPSIDRLDPHPERSLYAVFEVNRLIEASECIVASDDPIFSNHMTIGARFFQRPTARGSYVVVVEVSSRPIRLGEASQGGYQVFLGGCIAMAVKTAPVVKPNRKYTPQMYYIEPGDMGQFALIAPKTAEAPVFAQNLDFMAGQPWVPHAVVTPASTDNWTGPNLSQTFNVVHMPGLINIYSEYLDTYAQATILNVAVAPSEWITIPVVPGPLGPQ